jgi:hypothetical protein
VLVELMAASGQIESQALAVVGQKFGSLALESGSPTLARSFP